MFVCKEKRLAAVQSSNSRIRWGMHAPVVEKKRDLNHASLLIFARGGEMYAVVGVMCSYLSI